MFFHCYLKNIIVWNVINITFKTDNNKLKNFWRILYSEQKSTSRANNEGRLQACGWSLPNSPTSSQSALPTSTSTSETTSRTKVPVPIYCGPVFDDKPNYKVNFFYTNILCFRCNDNIIIFIYYCS